MNDERVKIAVRFETSEPGSYEIETMWATPGPDGYRIDNIPFYSKSLALGDVVSADRAVDGMLEYRALVRASGHSTVQIWFADEAHVSPTIAALRELGCDCEVSDLPKLVAFDVPPDVPYGAVRAFLDDGERRGLFEYQEACLGQIGAPGSA